MLLSFQHFNGILSMFHLRKATFLFSRENQWFCLSTHKQVFAAGVRRTCTNPTCGAHGQSPMTLFCNCTGGMHRGRQHNIWDVLDFFQDFFFVKAGMLIWMHVNSSAPPLSIWRRTSGFCCTSLPRVVTIVDREGWCFWNQKAAYRTTPPWKMTAMKPENAQQQEKVLWAVTHSSVQTAAAGNNTQYPNRTIVLAPNIVVFVFDQYNTIIGSCNGLRSYQPTTCGCQGSVFFFSGTDYCIAWAEGGSTTTHSTKIIPVDITQQLYPAEQHW